MWKLTQHFISHKSLVASTTYKKPTHNTYNTDQTHSHKNYCPDSNCQVFVSFLPLSTTISAIFQLSVRHSSHQNLPDIRKVTFEKMSVCIWCRECVLLVCAVFCTHTLSVHFFVRSCGRRDV